MPTRPPARDDLFHSLQNARDDLLRVLSRRSQKPCHTYVAVTSLEPEISRFRDEGILADSAAEGLIAIERRNLFSIHGELRVLAWVAITLVISGLGILLQQNFHRLGPALVLSALAIASAGLFAVAEWRRRRGVASSLADDSALLLAALLLAAAIGYAEAVYKLLDNYWSWHLIVIAIAHAVAAYHFGSRVLLSLSITALAAFLGINYDLIQTNLFFSYDLAVRGYLCAAILLAWRTLNLRYARRPEFTEVFDHTMALLILLSALTLVFESGSRVIGLVLLLPSVVAVFLHGWRERQQAFIFYAVIALLLGLGNAISQIIGDGAFFFIYVLVSTIAAIIFLFRVRARFREAA